jgi:hypothetical protein
VTIGVDGSMFAQPGQYSSTVTILSGAADPQYINVTVNATTAQSDVVATITPAHVVRTAAGGWSLTVKLAETAGVATTLSSVKVNGVDYSSSIQNWFGTAKIPANGSITAPLSGTGTFPPGTQFFEFTGVDASGQHWYRETTVNFQ